MITVCCSNRQQALSSGYDPAPLRTDRDLIVNVRFGENAPFSPAEIAQFRGLSDHAELGLNECPVLGAVASMQNGENGR